MTLATRRGSVIDCARSGIIAGMTDLLNHARRPVGRATPGRDTRRGRSPVLAAVLAALGAAGSVLLLTVAVALAGWFSADAGRYGDTRDASRVGADAWLLAHGAGISLDTASVTVLPLGLTLLCAVATYRAGRWAARTAGLGSAPVDHRAALHATGVLATVYGVVAMLVAVVATHPRAEAGLLRALGGGFVLAALAGGAGIMVASGVARSLVRAAPPWVRNVLVASASGTLLLMAASAFLATGALLADFGTAATVLSRLQADGPDGLLYTLVQITFVPNVVLLGIAYLLGPGFAVGAGTVVSPTAVVLGPLPSFPLLAALPDAGQATPSWATALVGVPVVVTALGVAAALRSGSAGRLDQGAVQGLGAGLVSAAVLAALVLLAGGAAGPGRMAEVGADGSGVLLAAVVSCGAGGLVGGLAGTWWGRRRTSAP